MFARAILTSRTGGPSLSRSAIFDLVVIESPSDEVKLFRAGLTDEARDAMADCEATVSAPHRDLYDLLGEVIDCLRAELP
jgi:hypothetical protein